jgi:hypothetical protein
MRIVVSLTTLWILIFGVGCRPNPENLEATLQSTSTAEPGDFSVIVTVYPVERMDLTMPVDPEVIPSFEPILGAIVSLVKNDLKEKTSVGLEKIHILEIEAVEWPDSSLGCGQPGEVYMPVITPGLRILLEVDGQVYSYHTNTTNRFILCEMPKPILINPTP